jgi:hypothetical protein
MMEDLTGGAGMGLAFEGRVPLAWSQNPEALAPGDAAGLQAGNHETLRVILALEDHVTEVPEERGANQPDLGRLDFKVNLLLELVGQLLERHMTLPAPVWVRLTAQQVEWESDQTLEPGTSGAVALFLCPRYPRPLVLRGRVSHVERSPEPLRMCLAYEGCSEPFLEDLERLIFRRHRRLIAQARRGAGPG